MRDKYEVLRRIQAAGCPIEVEVPAIESQSELTITQRGNSYLFDLGARGIGIALWVRLAREKPGLITIVEFGDLYVPWGTLPVMWLDQPPQRCLQVYRLPNGWDFPADTVLNHRLDERGLCLRSGRFVEGYILGTILEDRIPAGYRHGSILDAEFSLLDPLDHEFRGQVRFYVDRSTATVSQRRPARAGIGDPGERPRERAGDPLEEPRSDTPSPRDQPSGSLGDAE